VGSLPELTIPAPESTALASVARTVHASVAQENERWIEGLLSVGARHDAAFSELYTLLLKMSRAEAARRGAALRLSGPEIDDLAHQAAADAALVISRKIPTFRGDCRFTTWAYKFVQLDVSSKINRHFWNRPSASLDDGQEVATAAADAPDAEVEGRDLLSAVRRIIHDDLTDRQGRALEAVALHGVPIAQVATDLDSNANAIYKTLFDARRKLRRKLEEAGYLAPAVAEAPTS
jgi:RNA polymerase sigma-70 factor (ECF subfamily)